MKKLQSAAEATLHAMEQATTKPATRKRATKKPETASKTEQTTTVKEAPSFSTAKTEAGKEQKRLGQPRKYDENEEMKNINFKLPAHEIELLKQIAKINNMNATQYIRSVVKHDYEANKAILDLIMAKQKEIKR